MNLEELAFADELSKRSSALAYGSLDFIAALPLAQEALKIRERLLGNLHPSSINSIKEVASLLLEEGRAEEALPFVLWEVRSLKGVYGVSSKEFTYGMSLLSRCYEALGDYRKAVRCLRLQIATEFREEEVGNANETKICLARCLHKSGNSAEAIRLLEEARAILQDPSLRVHNGELKAYLELAAIERDLHGKEGLRDLFERIGKAVVQFDERQERRAPRLLKKIAKIYEEAGLNEIACEIDAVSEDLAAKRPKYDA